MDHFKIGSSFSLLFLKMSLGEFQESGFWERVTVLAYMVPTTWKRSH